MKEDAFSLIEIMIVVAIIGLIASIAIPAYQIQTTKSKIASFLPYLNNMKNEQMEFYEINGTFRNGFTTLVPGSSQVWYDNGGDCHNGFTCVSIPSSVACVRIQFPLSELSLSNASINLVAINNGGNIEWQCVTCRASATNNSSIPQQYLPSGCTQPQN